MRVLGIIGGMSWESSLEYYRAINRAVRDRLGGSHSAKLVLSSIDFQPMSDDMAAGRWDSVRDMLLVEARRLVAAGVDGMLIATNTMHVFADDVARVSGKPLIHIADSLGRKLNADGVERIALLGTKYSMEMPFYRERLERSFGVAVLVPEPEEREEINRIIFEELCRGVLRDESKRTILSIIDRLAARGARGAALACTELPLIVHADDTGVPLWDTLELHAEEAAAFILG
jgi:aspartate racemase